MKRSLAIALLTLFFVSCANSGFDREAAKNEILDIHDEVMPKIGQVMNLKKQVLEKADSEEDSVLINELQALSKELENAQQGMMVWMRQWSSSSEKHVKGESSEEEQVAFFDSEKKKVSKVRDDINNSIAAAQEKLK